MINMNENMKTYIKTGFVVLLIFSSCTTHKTLVNINPTNIAVFSVESFNGYYHNNSNEDTFYKSYTSPWYESLWGTLNKAYYTDEEPIVCGTDSLIVSLKFEKNKLIARLIENGNVVDEIVLKGKIKDNYILIRRKTSSCRFCNSMFWACESYKIIMGNTSNGNLIIKVGEDIVGCFVIMIGRDNNTYSKEYEKLNF